MCNHTSHGIMDEITYSYPNSSYIMLVTAPLRRYHDIGLGRINHKVIFPKSLKLYDCILYDLLPLMCIKRHWSLAYQWDFSAKDSSCNLRDNSNLIAKDMIHVLVIFWFQCLEVHLDLSYKVFVCTSSTTVLVCENLSSLLFTHSRHKCNHTSSH